MSEYHYGLIVTKKKHIYEVLGAKGYHTLQAIVFCIYVGPTNSLYNLNLLAASMNLFTINSLIYKGKDGYTKLSKRSYEIELFEGAAETSDEVEDILKRLHFSPTKNQVKHVYNVLYSIKPLILEWLTFTHELVFASEFAYHIDYCIRNNIEYLPEPDIYGLFPLNYTNDYQFHCDEGISKIIFDIVSIN